MLNNSDIRPARQATSPKNDRPITRGAGVQPCALLSTVLYVVRTDVRRADETRG